MTEITYESFKCPVCETRYILTIAPDEPRIQKRPTEISKLRLFIETFNRLGGEGRIDVNQEKLFDELLQTGKFSGDEAKLYLNKALSNGQIFERKPAFLAKA